LDLLKSKVAVRNWIAYKWQVRAFEDGAAPHNIGKKPSQEFSSPSIQNRCINERLTVLPMLGGQIKEWVSREQGPESLIA